MWQKNLIYNIDHKTSLSGAVEHLATWEMELAIQIPAVTVCVHMP